MTEGGRDGTVSVPTQGGAGAPDAITAGDGTGGDETPTPHAVGVPGGTVSDESGNLTLVFAPGALLGDTTFAFTPLVTIDGLPHEYVLVPGSAYRIDWTGAGFAPSGELTVQFGSDSSARREQKVIVRTLPESPARAFLDCTGVFVPSNEDGYDSWTFAGVCRPPGVEETPPGPGSATFALGTSGTPSTALPSIIRQPSPVSAPIGSAAAFSVVASAGGSLRFQWRRDGSEIDGATAAQYIIDPVKATDDGAKFSVLIENEVGQVSSDEVTLSVVPAVIPAAPYWSTATPLTAAFTANLDVPQVGSLAGAPLAVWNDAGTLRGSPGLPVPLPALALRSRPKLLTGPSFARGYVVFVDDDGTSACENTGNRLSAIALKLGSEGEAFPVSDRFLVYQPPDNACISGFSAGMAYDSNDLVFAVTDQASYELTLGAVGATFIADGGKTPGGVTIGHWTVGTSVSAMLDLDPDCAGPASLTEDGLMGNMQSLGFDSSASTRAVLAWMANGNLCAATLEGGDADGGAGGAAGGGGAAATGADVTWSRGKVLMRDAGEAEPVAVIGGQGQVLVLGSVPVPRGDSVEYAMRAAFRGAAESSWHITDLDASDGTALPSAAFLPSGEALVVWRPALPAPPTRAYAARRTRAGAWDLPATAISSDDAADVRYPRICADQAGNALALFEESAPSAGDATPFQVWGRVWRAGSWSAPARVSPSLTEQRFADCVRQSPSSLAGVPGPFTVWRETDPADPTLFRLVEAQ